MSFSSRRIKVTRQNHPLRHFTSMSSTRMTKIPPFKVTNTKFSFLETLKRYTILLLLLYFYIIIIYFIIIIINSNTDNIYLPSIFLEFASIPKFFNYNCRMARFFYLKLSSKFSSFVRWFFVIEFNENSAHKKI